MEKIAFISGGTFVYWSSIILALAAAAAALAGQVKRSAVKSKTVTDAGIELTLEVALSSMATAFVNSLNAIEGVESAALVSYNGDYTA